MRARAPSSSRRTRAYSRHRRRKPRRMLLLEERHGPPHLHPRRRLSARCFPLHVGVATLSRCFGSPHRRGWALSTISRTGVRVRGDSTPPQEGAMRGKVPTRGGSQEGVVQPPEQLVTPAAASPASLLAGPPSLLHQVYPRLDVTPVVSHASAAAQFFLRRNANNRSNYACLPAISTGSALSETRVSRLYTKATLPDITQDVRSRLGRGMRLRRKPHFPTAALPPQVGQRIQGLRWRFRSQDMVKAYGVVLVVLISFLLRE